MLLSRGVEGSARRSPSNHRPMIVRKVLIPTAVLEDESVACSAECARAATPSSRRIEGVFVGRLTPGRAIARDVGADMAVAQADVNRMHQEQPARGIHITWNTSAECVRPHMAVQQQVKE